LIWIWFYSLFSFSPSSSKFLPKDPLVPISFQNDSLNRFSLQDTFNPLTFPPSSLKNSKKSPKTKRKWKFLDVLILITFLLAPMKKLNCIPKVQSIVKKVFPFFLPFFNFQQQTIGEKQQNHVIKKDRWKKEENYFIFLYSVLFFVNFICVGNCTAIFILLTFFLFWCRFLLYLFSDFCFRIFLIFLSDAKNQEEIYNLFFFGGGGVRFGWNEWR